MNSTIDAARMAELGVIGPVDEMVEELAPLLSPAKIDMQMAVAHRIPVRALSASLAYFDRYRTAVQPQNLTEAQRDYSRAHAYQRIDRPEAGFVHTDWPSRGPTCAMSSC